MLKQSSLIYSTLFSVLLALPAVADDSADWVKSRSLDSSALAQISRADSAASKERQIRALLALADRDINRSIGDSTQYLERAEEMIEANSDAQTVALAIRCKLEHRLSLPGASSSCGRVNELKLSTHGDFVAAIAHVTRMTYHYQEGQHERSMQEAELALERATLINDPALMGASHNMLGLYYLARLRPRMSLTHFENAIEQADNLPYAGPRILTQINLASSYTYLGRASEALQILKEARQTSVVDLYPNRRLVVQSMIGQAQAALGETDTAEQDLQNVIDEVIDSVLPDGLIIGYTGLGIIQLAKNRYEAALSTLDKVLELTGKSFEADMDYPRIQLVAVPYASALRESGRIDEARILLQLVIDEAQYEPDQILVNAYQELALTLEKAGDTAGAYEAVKNHVRVESTLWNASLRYQLARLNASVEAQRSRLELQQAKEREQNLRAIAERESRLKLQSWFIGIMLLAVIALLFSRHMQKRIADTERALSANLEDQVKKRTRELEQEMNKRTAAEVERRRLAEHVHEGEKLKAMGRITAGVAHDFNNLMTVITLGSDELKTHLVHDDNHDVTQTLEQIYRAADTGAKITRGLLSYVREQPLQSQDVQLDKVLERALPMFGNTLGERISLDLSKQPCRVVVDEGQLVTALLNLLLNAKESMPEGGNVKVTLTSADKLAKIEVRDHGRGMDETVLKHAVDPFFTTKENEEGSGLGLSMVYGFARQSNGDLLIESMPGVGTTVTLLLPLQQSTSAPILSPQRQPRRIPKGTRMLAVEDRPQILQVLAKTLKKLGGDVSTASSADEALKVIEQTGLPDILITDIVMPGELDGLDLVAQLRKRDPDLPVVLVSGYSREVDKDCTFLRKPFSSAELESAIKKTLERVSRGGT